MAKLTIWHDCDTENPLEYGLDNSMLYISGGRNSCTYDYNDAVHSTIIALATGKDCKARRQIRKMLRRAHWTEYAQDHGLTFDYIGEFLAEYDSTSLVFLLDGIDGWTVDVIYKYEHGGVAFRVSPFSCQWDSGQVGYIATRHSDHHESIISEFSQWANGETYGYTITDDNGECVDSCGGFIGADYLQQHLVAEGLTVDAIDVALFNIEY